MRESELRQRVCDTARAWLGKRESDDSHREILAVYNRISPLPRGYKMGDLDPWCAAFVSAVGEKCGLGTVLLPECGCEAMIALYRARGRWREDDGFVPQPGDLIFYDWQDAGTGDCTGGADHVGLVLWVAEGVMEIIEGNLSDAVGLRRLPVNARYIRGFALPDYASAAEKPDTAPVSQPEPESRRALIRLPWLCYGDTGTAVESLQLLLIGRGYRCGPCGADGDFGANTRSALFRFQQQRGLEADGVAGPETWGSLLLDEGKVKSEE